MGVADWQRATHQGLLLGAIGFVGKYRLDEGG
jgi:hypothetical protein